MYYLLPIFFLLWNTASALTFDLPKSGNVVGQIQQASVQKGESLSDIGRRFDVGVYEMIEANPNLDPWMPPTGSIVVIPTQFILPKYTKSQMIINLAEMRLYYFDVSAKKVSTYPLGIGKKGWVTPLGSSTITRKRKNPPWYPPKGIRKEHEDRGDFDLPSMIPGGVPENPLGHYALYLDTSGLSGSGAFLIHGTNRPAGVGVRTTHGCIRLYPEDIEKLYHEVPSKTPVEIIHEPLKLGWKDKRLHLEAHEPLSEPRFSKSNSLARLKKLIGKYLVNWESAEQALRHSKGYPVIID